VALTSAACSESSPAAPTLDAGTDAARPDTGGTVIPDAGADSMIGPLPDAATGIRYDEPGPIPFTVMEERVMNGGDRIDVTVYLPSTPGPHPVVAFSCGSQQTAAGYVPYGERLASYGIGMILMDDPGAFTNTADVVPNAVYIVETWLPATFPDTLDASRVGLGGHSRGGAVSLLAAEHGLLGQVDAWFGLDPVDNQFGMAPREYARTDLPEIGIPTTFLGAEVVSNCAPTADSYEILHPLAPEPSVLIVGLGAGHTQFELASGCTACGVCSPDGTADHDVVLAYAVRYFTAFFARELLGDTAVGPLFEGAGAPADIAAGLVTVE
jgi:hypothetical protein